LWLSFCLKFVTFKLGLVTTARLLCTCFLFSIKGWAYGNNKLLHSLGLVVVASFYIYLSLWQQQVFSLTWLGVTTSFYNYFLLWVKGLQHSNLDLCTIFLFFNLWFATFICFCVVHHLCLHRQLMGLRFSKSFDVYHTLKLLAFYCFSLVSCVHCVQWLLSRYNITCNRLCATILSNLQLPCILSYFLQLIVYSRFTSIHGSYTTS